MMYNKAMSITKVQNGWILELPYNENTDMMANMMEQLPKAIRAKDQDEMLQPKQEYTPLLPYHTVINTKIYVFLTFKEMMSFIELSFDQVND